MNIYGKKTMLRALDDRDVAFLHRLINDPEVEFLVGGYSFPVSMKEQESWMARQGGNPSVLRCAIVDLEQQEQAFGTVFLTDIDYKNGTAQIHIKLLKEFSGKGYGTDAISTLSRYAIEELRMNCIYAEVLAHNEASCRMFFKCGYRKDGVLRQRIFKKGAFRDVIVFSLTSGDL